MKKIIALVVVALALSGCARAEVADVAEARDECHNFGGVFTSWYTPELGYLWECDLSDKTSPESQTGDDR